MLAPELGIYEGFGIGLSETLCRFVFVSFSPATINFSDSGSLRKKGIFWLMVPGYCPSQWGSLDNRSLQELLTSHLSSGSTEMEKG